jgi:hypothetical protein
MRLARRGGTALRALRFRYDLCFGPLVALALAGCEPTVKVEAPKEPITINLNIKLDADVRVQLEREAQEDVKKSDIF